MEDNLQEKQTDAVLETGKEVLITPVNETIWHKIGLAKRYKRYILKPITLGTLLQIAKEVEKIKIDPQDIQGSGFDFAIDSVLKYKDTLLSIITYGFLNSPNDGLIFRIKFYFLRRYLDRNVSSSEVLRLFSLIVERMEISDFFTCIVSIKGTMNLTKPETEKPETAGS